MVKSGCRLNVLESGKGMAMEDCCFVGSYQWIELYDGIYSEFKEGNRGRFNDQEGMSRLCADGLVLLAPEYVRGLCSMDFYVCILCMYFCV